MEECRRLIDDGQPRRSTPTNMTCDSRPDVDETLHKGTSEIHELTHLLYMQSSEITCDE